MVAAVSTAVADGKSCSGGGNTNVVNNTTNNNSSQSGGGGSNQVAAVYDQELAGAMLATMSA